MSIKGNKDKKIYQITDLTSNCSNRRNSGIIDAYTINASESGSATFANPICASASFVYKGATGVNGVTPAGTAAELLAVLPDPEPSIPDPPLLLLLLRLRLLRLLSEEEEVLPCKSGDVSAVEMIEGVSP